MYIVKNIQKVTVSTSFKSYEPVTVIIIQIYLCNILSWRPNSTSVFVCLGLCYAVGAFGETRPLPFIIPFLKKEQFLTFSFIFFLSLFLCSSSAAYSAHLPHTYSAVQAHSSSTQRKVLFYPANGKKRCKKIYTFEIKIYPQCKFDGSKMSYFLLLKLFIYFFSGKSRLAKRK